MHDPVPLAPKSFHHIYLNQIGSTIVICGPDWRSLIQAWKIVEDDVIITFKYDDSSNVFNINVTSGDGEAKAIFFFILHFL
jgi:hypothetical protein